MNRKENLFSSFSLRAAVAKRQLLGCLAHAPAREAIFCSSQAPWAAVFAFVALQVSPVTGALIGYHNKRDTPIYILAAVCLITRE